MEAMFDYVFMTLSALADKYTWLSYTLMAIGALYVFLTACRAFLTAVVKITKTETDDKVIASVFAFLDKFAYGFGKLGEYFESKTKDSKDK